MALDTKVYSNFSLNTEDIKILNLLYLPLLGDEAITLYSFLHTLLNRVSLESEALERDNLLNFLGWKLMKFNKALAKLEGINLARTFVKEDMTIIILLAPFTPKNFLKDTILGSYLENKIGKETFAKIVDAFKIPPLDLKDFKEVTHNFGDVFKEELNYDYQRPEENIVGRRPNHRNLTNGSDFDIDLFISKIDTNLVNGGIDEDFKKKITTTSFVYGYTLEQMVNLFHDSIDKNNYFSYDILKKKAQSLYNFLYKTKETVVNKEDDIILKVENLEKMSAQSLLQELMGPNYPVMLLQKINELYNNINMSHGLVNLMIIKVYASKGSIPALSYFEKMAKSWQDNGIFTTYDAIEKMNKPKTSPRKKNSKDINLEDWQIAGMEEIMKGFKANGETKN